MTHGGFGIVQFRKLLVVGSFSVAVEFLMGLSDSVVGGHLLGESALAAIGLLAPVRTSITFFAARPISLPALTAARSMSPVEICGMPYFLQMKVAWVPLPAPATRTMRRWA